ncbi:hypothetical protein PILCRDRAFT_99039 [Piloderma croceum F 1598]|uniref:Cytochrome P450 n=1 Tax=Piloderma croceum (strain F 1598) TaxID=765440 RepID=A0A0C3F5H4_PILCF|nr:hypothetical protein PILCRDRAFT_99039 [Piloderma croceum F 1598]
MSLTYDAPVLKNLDDPAVAPLDGFLAHLSRAAYPGAHLVEFFTWMRYLPSWMAKWKRDAVAGHEKYSTTFLQLYDVVCQRVAGGDQRPSFASLLAQNEYGLNVKESAWLTGSLYAAGSEITAAVLSWFLLAMVIFPDVQRKAQAELDEVVGRGQLPTFADYENLPYIRALVKETLRWRPVDPQGIPRRVVQDDMYGGYHIPKGAICIPNVWAMNRDPDIYGADAHEFNPSRHLDSEGKIKPDIVDMKEESHGKLLVFCSL